MTGFRIGYACARRHFENMMKLHQYAIMSALDHRPEAAAEASNAAMPPLPPCGPNTIAAAIISSRLQ